MIDIKLDDMLEFLKGVDLKPKPKIKSNFSIEDMDRLFKESKKRGYIETEIIPKSLRPDK